ncbi:ABC transporter permease [Bacteroidota bacterium]
MLENYLKIALRSLWKYKGYTFINVFGLALGMACSLFIFLWVQDELSYDRFHENADSIFRVEQDQHYSGAIFHVTVTPHPVGPAFVEELSEVVNAVRFNWMRPRLIRRGDRAFYEGGVAMTDASIFEMLSFPVIAGDPETALDDPYSVVMTRKVAEKYFPDEDPIGQTVTMENEYDLTVTAVLEDLPDNSMLQFGVLMSFELMHSFGWYDDDWGNNSIMTLVQAAEGVTTAQVTAGMDRVMHAHREDPPDYMAMPLTSVHLYSYWGYGKPMGQIKYVYIFSAIALFVLLIACINFMNLSTARSARRAREIGMRKAVGARRANVARQFLGESMLLSVIALLFAIAFVAALLGPSEALTGKEFSPLLLLQWNVVFGMLGIAVFTGFVAGSYPALVLSSIKPSAILKSSTDSGTGRSRFRQVLVVVQFGLSIFLIIGTGVVTQQLDYMRDADLGFNQDHLLFVRVREDILPAYDELRAGWLGDPLIHAVTSSLDLPNNIGSNSASAQWIGKDPDDQRLIGFSRVGYDYAQSLEIGFAAGRGFSRDHISDMTIDSTGAWLINEETAKLMKMETVIGEEFDFQGVKGPVVGVMKNFHFNSLRNGIEPLALLLDPEAANFVMIRIDPVRIDESIAHIEATWNEIVPMYPFEFTFMDENFENIYRTETQMSRLLTWFSVIAILIGCLGLIGLAAFTTQQRRKEIGIRRVLGASQYVISSLLAREFLVLVLISNAIAWPVAYLASRSWLDSFAYHADVGFALFAVTGLAVIVIAMATVSYQSIRAAVADPVDALRAD